jgi:serine/threonine protein kinase
MSAQIVIVSGPDKGRSFPLTPGTTLQVGRSQATATKLTDQSVSRVHCEIEYDGARAMLVNISTNGTTINGKPVTEHELKHGEVVRVGGTEFRYQVAAVEEAETVLQSARPALPGKLTELPGHVVSHYAIESVIAKGQSGVVFKAKDTRDNKTVAIKVLQPEFSRNEDEMQRFIRAMKTVLGLQHPNLVTLLAAGKTGAFCWVVMEYVEGESLSQVIQRIGVAGMLDWRYGYRVAVQVGRALEYAHGKSIIHRNVTPSNILLRTADKTAMLGDLMLAKALEGTLAQQVTRPGELLGDIGYMSPERTRGVGDIDGRSDIYGLGATVYALIAGRPPFAGGTLPELIQKIRSAEPEKPKKYQMAIPDLFQGAVMKMLAKRPEERFQTAAELLTDLERVGKFAGISV